MFSTISNIISNFVQNCIKISRSIRRSFSERPTRTAIYALFIITVTVGISIFLPTYIAMVINTGLTITGLTAILASLGTIYVLLDLIHTLVMNGSGSRAAFLIVQLAFTSHYVALGALTGCAYNVFFIVMLARHWCLRTLREETLRDENTRTVAPPRLYIV